MNDQNNKIYRYNDTFSFRKCSLSEDVKSQKTGDCTSFKDIHENYKDYYVCSQHGIHLHCTKHPEIELLEIERRYSFSVLKCPKCDIELEVDKDGMIKECLKLLNIPKFKNAKFVRLDEIGIHQKLRKK